MISYVEGQGEQDNIGGSGQSGGPLPTSNNNPNNDNAGVNGAIQSRTNSATETQEEAMTKLEQENQTLLGRVEELEQRFQNLEQERIEEAKKFEELSEKVERFEHFREIIEELKDKLSSEKSETILTWFVNKVSSYIKEPEDKKKSAQVENLNPKPDLESRVNELNVKLTNLESRVKELNVKEGSKDEKSTDGMDQRKHQSHSSHHPPNNSDQRWMDTHSQKFPPSYSQSQNSLSSQKKKETHFMKKPEPKVYYSSQGEPMVRNFMEKNLKMKCEYIEVNFDCKSITFQQPCFLFIFVVITDRFDDPASWGNWIEKRIQETEGRCVLIRLHSNEKQMEMKNPSDIPGSIQTLSFQFSTKVDKSGIGKSERSIKDENNLKKTLIKFMNDM